MLHFDGIQKKLLLIMGAFILILSAGLIYSEARNNKAGSLQEASSLQQEVWARGVEEAPGSNADENFADEANQLETVKVYITGQVVNPGVYSVSGDKRLVDAIEQAGGFTPQADLNRINLAAKVVDEGMYYVPAVDEEVLPDLLSLQSNGREKTGKVNINHADQSQLETLTGIGPAKAQKIIEYRNEHGGFNSIEEIMNVSGIGEKTFESIKDQISVR
jgi:competence protein ComEA